MVPEEQVLFGADEREPDGAPAGVERQVSPEELLEGLNEPQRAAVDARRRAAARRRRRRVRQDPGADPPDRLADLRARRPPRLDPGDHLHQQGRRGDARAGRGPRRPPGPDHVGLDVPLRLRAHPAQGDRALRLQVGVLDLRRRRLQAADDAGLPRPRAGPQALPAARGPQLGVEPEERAASTTRRPRRDAGNDLERDLRRGLRACTSSACATPTRWTSTT